MGLIGIEIIRKHFGRGELLQAEYSGRKVLLQVISLIWCDSVI